jgi:hypothetical protein
MTTTEAPQPQTEQQALDRARRAALDSIDALSWDVIRLQAEDREARRRSWAAQLHSSPR